MALPKATGSTARSHVRPSPLVTTWAPADPDPIATKRSPDAATRSSRSVPLSWTSAAPDGTALHWTGLIGAATNLSRVPTATVVPASAASSSAAARRSFSGVHPPGLGRVAAPKTAARTRSGGSTNAIARSRAASA